MNFEFFNYKHVSKTAFESILPKLLSSWVSLESRGKGVYTHEKSFLFEIRSKK